MITRQLKLKLNKSQEIELERWLYHLTSIYNWAIKKIENDARDKIYYSKFEFSSLLDGTSKKIDIPSRLIRGILRQAHKAWKLCFMRANRKPKLKGRRNKLNSIPLLDQVIISNGSKARIPRLGFVGFFKQGLPEGDVKDSRIVKKSSGWYLNLVIDTIHTFPVKETNEVVGIDPGFSTLLTLSNGVKIENPRELRKGELRLTQAQRGKDYKLTARLYERQANKVRDRNHKISRKLIENYKTIYYSNDSFKGLSKKFGKSVQEAGLGQLIGMMNYKGLCVGREIIPIKSNYTTMTCSVCGSRSGPTGWSGLAVRHWECLACGANHDRDINAAKVVLNVGLGINLKESVIGLNRQESLCLRNSRRLSMFKNTYSLMEEKRI